MAFIFNIFRSISGNFFAGYLLGFSTILILPKRAFRALALGYYDYQELDDVPQIIKK